MDDETGAGDASEITHESGGRACDPANHSYRYTSHSNLIVRQSRRELE